MLRRLKELKTVILEDFRKTLREIHRNNGAEELEELLSLIVKELEGLHKENEELKEKIKELERRIPEPNGK